MLQRLFDCLGFNRKVTPYPPISWPRNRNSVTSIQVPRDVPERDGLLPPVPPSSPFMSQDFSADLHEAEAQPPARPPKSIARRYGLDVLIAALSPAPSAPDLPLSPRLSHAPAHDVDMPTDVDENDEMMPRLSYMDKRKWPEGRPPRPQSVSLPDVSIDGHVAAQGSDGSDYSSGSSRTSTFYA